MVQSSTLQEAERLLREGWSDEEVERLTGLSLDAILVLRAEAASAPAMTKPGRAFRAAIRAKASGRPAGQVAPPPARKEPDKPPLDGRSPA